MNRDQPIIVLGMHRSGTSCLAGCLEEAGLRLGNVVTSAPHNKKGNRELRKITRLHERVLQENRGSWRSPPDSVHWSTECIVAHKRLVSEIAGDEPWGFKDPRTLLVIERWLSEFPQARLVGSFRHPKAVAASLFRRDGLPLSDGVALWLRYNKELRALWSQRPFPLVEFGTPMERYLNAVTAICRELNLVSPGEFEFPTPTLIHNKPDASGYLPGSVSDLYRKLKANAY